MCVNCVNSLEVSFILFCGLLHESVAIPGYISSMMGYVVNDEDMYVGGINLMEFLGVYVDRLWHIMKTLRRANIPTDVPVLPIYSGLEC